MLLTNLGITGVPTAEASTTNKTVSIEIQTNSYDKDELISNLDLAQKVIEENGLTRNSLRKLHSNLTQIEERFNEIESKVVLRNLISNTGKTLTNANSQNSLRKSNEFIESLDVIERLKGRLGLVASNSPSITFSVNQNNQRNQPNQLSLQAVANTLIKPSQNNKIGNITVKYGRHDYASNNQAEYNKVMEIISKAINAHYNQISFGGKYAQYYEEYLNGERYNGNRRDRTEKNIGLFYADSSIGDLVNEGVSEEEIKKLWKAAVIANELYKFKPDTKGNGATKSAYDTLVLETTDCDATAQVISAVFDSMGYNTMIFGTQVHVEAYVEIKGNWYNIGADSFTKVDIEKAKKKGYFVFTESTYK